MPRGKDLFDDEFDKMFDSPVKTFFKLGLVAVLLNLALYAALAGLIAWLVWLVFL